MATLNELKKYLNGGIEDYGCTTSPSYKTFQNKYRNYLKKVAKELNGELVKFMPNHYEFSCFIKRNGKFVYISISDVRYFKNEWYNRILIRRTMDENDYKGFTNNICSLDNIANKIVSLTD